MGGLFFSNLAERGGFEPPRRYKRLPDFESGTFNRSATSPDGPRRTGLRMIKGIAIFDKRFFHKPSCAQAQRALSSICAGRSQCLPYTSMNAMMQRISC